MSELTGKIDVQLSPCPFDGAVPVMEVVDARDLTNGKKGDTKVWVASIECPTCRVCKSMIDADRVTAVNAAVEAWEKRIKGFDHLINIEPHLERMKRFDLLLKMTIDESFANGRNAGLQEAIEVIDGAGEQGGVPTPAPDVDAVIAQLRAFASEHLAGGCKMLSLGSACKCNLCAVDNLASAIIAMREQIALTQAVHADAVTALIKKP